jgi:hypothetical protein
MSSIRLKRGTASQWFTKNPILKSGELGVEIDTKKMKLGDSTTRWNSLSYITVVPTDLGNTLDSYIESSEKGNAGGVATLNSSGVIPDSQIPSGIARDTEIVTSYNDLDDAPALFSGSYTDLTEKPTLFSGSYDDLSNKPTIPSLTGYATETYVETAISNLVDSAPGTLNTLNELAAAINDDASYAATITTSLGLKAPLADPTFTGTVSGITKTMVGLGNLDNTSDLDKPISTATQSALDNKSDKIIVISSKSESYVIQDTDLGKLIEMSSGGTVTITDSSSFPIGFSVDIVQTGSSQVTIAGTSFTPNATPGLKLRAQWSSATLIKRALNSWVVLGDLSA